MFRFADPIYFLLLLPWIIGVVRVCRRRIQSGILFAPVHRISARLRFRRRLQIAMIPMMWITGSALLIIALARPQSVLSISRSTSDVIAINMVVDVSGSMRALDLSEISNGRIIKNRTRLDVVKSTFSEFIDKRPDDLIGLVTFGGFASTRCPLTLDHSALRHVLSGVDLPKDHEVIHQDELSTAIGDGLATACARMQDAEAQSRIVVLLSDGESNTGLISPVDAVRAAKELDIKVYTIGVGSTGTAPVMVTDDFGRSVIARTEVRLDEEQLKAIADGTGGRYFNARDAEGLQAALDDIDALEKTRIERELVQYHDEHFPRALIPALLLIAAAMVLNPSRRLI